MAYTPETFRREVWYLESSIHRLLFSCQKEVYLTIIHNSDNRVDFTLTGRLGDDSTFEDTIGLVNSINLSRQTDTVLFYAHLRSGEERSFTSELPFAFCRLHDGQCKAKLAGMSVIISKI